MTRQFKIGKIHRWWLNEFLRASGQSMFVDTSGYAGTPYGKALGSLVKNNFISIEQSFEGGLTALKLTALGKSEVKE